MLRETRSTCPYCGVGCGVIIESEGAQITGVRGDPDHPANFGKLCTKGSTLALTASSPINRQTRLLQPMRREHRDEKAKPVSWDSALDFAATSFAQIIQEHGPDSVGFYISGQLLTEDYYLFNKLAKGQIGTNNVDTNSRLCMSSAVAGYKQTLGADAPPACYDDVNHASCIFIVGSNTAYAHPILFRRIEEAKKSNPSLRIVFADPRKTDTAEIADLYLPLLPGTDVALFNGMLHIMLWEGWLDTSYIAAHTNGFDELKSLVREYTPESVAQICGIKKDDLFAAAKLFATSSATLSLYCQGLNQSSSGTAKNASLINLHLATAQIGKPGAGPFSLTGQPNAMGGREVGGLANLISAHRDMANPVHRAEVAALWGVKDVPSTPGKTAVEMFQAAADGQIKALWIACTNPAQSMPDQAVVRKALERAEIVVLQEAFVNTETARYADLLLPATTWGEKEGTVTNSERRITRVRAAVPAPGEARHDWQITQDFAQRLEKLTGVRTQLIPAKETINQVLSPIHFLNYGNPEAIWEEHKASTAGRDLDITGLSYALLDQAAQQWPYLQGDTTGKARLYEDGVFPTADGKAQFKAYGYKPVAEPRESRYPFSLTTGRLRDQWHGMSRTGSLGRLFGHVPEPVVQMNPQDMNRRFLKEGELVHVTSKRGSILLPVQASAEVGLTQAFIAMHWGSEYLSGIASNGERISGVNAITTSSYCPISKQPELKHAAVKILKAEMPWTVLAVAWIPAESAWHVREQLKDLMHRFPFTSCVPFSDGVPLTEASRGKERHGILFRAAAYEQPDDAQADPLLEQIERILGLQDANSLRYADKKRGQRRAIRVKREGAQAQLEGFLLAGDTSSQAWITALLQGQQDASAYGRLLLVPGSQAPVAIQAKGAQICSCFNVTTPQIATFLRAYVGQESECLNALQADLKCGTNCGSCVPELKKLIRQQISGRRGASDSASIGVA
jgi:assimilatory nitrate reductase catalytic subunit